MSGLRFGEQSHFFGIKSGIFGLYTLTHEGSVALDERAVYDSLQRTEHLPDTLTD